MGRIVGVHGIMQEQFGRTQLLRAWEPALQDGLEVSGQGQEIPAYHFELAFYGDVFLDSSQQGDPLVKGAASRVADTSDALADGEMEFLIKSAEEAVQHQPDLGAEMGPTSVSPLFRPLVRMITRHFDGRIAMPFIGVLRQVYTYQHDEQLAERIRARLAATIGDGCDVLISHSMGTLVALESLVLDPLLKVDVLVTLGAPLAMQTVAAGLRGRTAVGYPMPPQIRRWVNIFDPRDPVAGAGRVGDRWPDVEDWGVDNGDLPHAIGHYLSKRITGQTVREALQRARHDG